MNRQNSSRIRQLCIECQQDQQKKVSNSIHCQQLFELALIDDDHEAWETLLTLFSPMVKRWIYKSPLYSMAGEEVDFLLSGVWSRFWEYARTPAQQGNFPTLANYLAYLASLVFSELKVSIQAQKDEQIDDWLEKLPAQTPSISNQVQFKLFSDRIWDCLNQCLETEQERIVSECSWIDDDPPRKIHEQYPDLFQSVEEVKNIKKRILRRFKNQFSAILEEV